MSIMKEQMKQQIATDFEKAKSAGGARVERIRQIFKEALTQTVTEMKAGTGEIGSIAKDSTSNLIDTLPQKQTTAQASAQTSPVVEVKPIEVTIEDGDSADVPTVEPTVNPTTEPTVKYAIVDVADTTVQIEPAVMPEIAPETASTAPMETSIDANSTANEIVHVETAEQTPPETAQTFADSLKALAEQFIQDIKQGEAYANLQQQLIKLKQQLGILDTKLSSRYGERYETIKQDFRNDATRIKTWYEGEKANASTTGTTWVEQKQSNLDGRFEQAGATIAQKEQKIKQLLKELWQTVRSKQ
jgi:hypothetical protein